MISTVLRDKVLDFVDQRITVEELEDWLVPKVEQFIANPDSDDADLVSAVELALSEMSAGFRTMEQTSEYLLAILRTSFITISNDVPVIATGTSSQTYQTYRQSADIPFSNEQPTLVWSQQ